MGPNLLHKHLIGGLLIGFILLVTIRSVEQLEYEDSSDSDACDKNQRGYDRSLSVGAATDGDEDQSDSDVEFYQPDRKHRGRDRWWGHKSCIWKKSKGIPVSHLWCCRKYGICNDPPPRPRPQPPRPAPPPPPPEPPKPKTSPTPNNGGSTTEKIKGPWAPNPPQ